MDATVMTIKKSLSWCQMYIKQAEDAGDLMVKNLMEARDASYQMTYLQIIFIAVYGVVWVVVVRQIGK